jgi:Uma2 family endonuclease
MSSVSLYLKSHLAMRLNAQAPEDTWISPGIFTIGDLAAGWAAFPDIAVMPEPREFDPLDRNVVANPSILMEVTSDFTERADRGIKLRLYRAMRSVEAVAIVSHRRPHVEVHRRSGGVWTVTEATSGAIAVAGYSLDLRDLYRDLSDP